MTVLWTYIFQLTNFLLFTAVGSLVCMPTELITYYIHNGSWENSRSLLNLHNTAYTDT
jgi:hypothetical protein